jgi:hypothetical protein
MNTYLSRCARVVTATGLTLSVMMLAPAVGVASAAKTDPCATAGGDAHYTDPLIAQGLSFYTLNLTNNLGTDDPNSDSPAPLCDGWTYVVTISSADGSSLGWQTTSMSNGATVNVSADGSTVTAALAPSETTDHLLAFAGTTNGYSAQPADCSAPGVGVSVTMTSPKGRGSTWTGRSLCEAGGAGGGSFYG